MPLRVIEGKTYITAWTVNVVLPRHIQTIPGLPTAPGYLKVDVDPKTGEIDGLF